jgi:hypothetical protein
MDYLYGDSSPSPLQSDFLGFLGDTLDFAVHVLLADERIKRGRTEITARKGEADAEIARLEGLVAIVKKAVAGAPKVEPDTPTARCAATILSEVDSILRIEVERVRTAHAKEVARIETEERRERGECGKVLERLLKRVTGPTNS